MRARFVGDVRAPGQARAFVSTHLDSLVDAAGVPTSNDIVLAVSELVTNSVRAGASTIDVHLDVGTRKIELRVKDDAAGWPSPRTADPDDVGGRGLSIVERLSDSWTARAHDPGKTVTATWLRG